MNERLSSWANLAEIASGIAVVITLVVLSVGIRENTEVMKSSIYTQSIDSLNQFRDAGFRDREAARIWRAFQISDTDEFDDVDMARLQQMMLTLFTI